MGRWNFDAFVMSRMLLSMLMEGRTGRKRREKM